MRKLCTQVIVGMCLPDSPSAMQYTCNSKFMYKICGQLEGILMECPLT